MIKFRIGNIEEGNKTCKNIAQNWRNSIAQRTEISQSWQTKVPSYFYLVKEVNKLCKLSYNDSSLIDITASLEKVTMLYEARKLILILRVAWSRVHHYSKSQCLMPLIQSIWDLIRNSIFSPVSFFIPFPEGQSGNDIVVVAAAAAATLL